MKSIAGRRIPAVVCANNNLPDTALVIPPSPSHDLTVSSPPPPPRIFSPRRQRSAFARAVARQQQGGAATFLFDDMREEVKERLAFMRLEPRDALVVGDPTGLLASDLRSMGATTALLSSSWTGEGALPVPACDLIVHDAGLAVINDLPGALLHLRQGLRTGGLLIAAIVGAGSLPMLRAAMLAAEPDRPHPRIHPQIDNHSASALLQRAGFARQVVDSHKLSVRYNALERLVADLRDQALGNVLADPAPALSRSALQRARDAFRSRADADGRTTETFEIITMTAWRS